MLSFDTLFASVDGTSGKQATKKRYTVIII